MFILLLAGCIENPPVPVDPLAVNAGADRSATIDESLTLTAAASGGTEPYQYRWMIDDVPAGDEIGEIPDNLQAEIETLPFITGRYVYRVVVTDAVGATDDDFVAIDVAATFEVTVSRVDDGPTPPGTNVPVTLEADVTTSRAVTYAWRVTQGSGVAIEDETSSATGAVACAPGEVTIEVEATDQSNGETAVGSITFDVASGDRPRVAMTIASDAAGVSGEVVFELYSNAAPLTVANLLQYIDAGFYDGVLWHRVSRSPDETPFVVQMGGFTRDGEFLAVKEPPFDPVAGEPDNGFSNLPGTIAMALRGGDPDSGTSQVFVNLADNSFLDPTFTVFGQVVAGMDILEAMAQLETGSADLDVGGTLTEVPTTDVVIERFTCAFGQ